jgi:hypothetical protein
VDASKRMANDEMQNDHKHRSVVPQQEKRKFFAITKHDKESKSLSVQSSTSSQKGLVAYPNVLKDVIFFDKKY